MPESGLNGVPLLPERPKKNVVANGPHLSLVCRGSIPAALGLLFTVAVTCAQVPAVQPGKLRLLTTAREAHSLSAAESRRGYPVHLRAVVTYYDPYIDARHGALFVHDATGGIFVAIPKKPVLPLQAGTLVDVVGVTSAGDYASMIEGSAVRVIGNSHLPEDAPRVSLSHLLTGADDGQWVEVSALVHSVAVSEWNATFDLAMTDGIVRATTLRQKGVDYDRLVDARVSIRGSAAPIFNSNHQMSGARLFFPSLEAVTIEEPAPADPFALPTRPVDGLLRYVPGRTFLHRVRVRGRVTLQWPGRLLCI